jgi:predicted ATPase with chaperone activity
MTTESTTFEIDPELVASLLTDEVFRPSEPTTLEETGLSETLIESLICKRLAVCGSASGREVAKDLCLPFSIVTKILDSLRGRKYLTHSGSAHFNDFTYVLSEAGSNRAQEMLRDCAYIGPAPVLLSEYVVSVGAQSIEHEAPNRERLTEACDGISVDPKLFNSLGPAINSGGAMFLYGAPGNGKSTLAQRITMCFGQSVWVPHAIFEGGQIIKFFDPQFHRPVENTDEETLRTAGIDRRWVQVSRPTVIVGGELTLENLELRHHPEANVCEAPLQLKSNCGCLLIDDFGRQRIAPADLLNRWIIPLEAHHDFLTLPTGRKIQVPFSQIVIFSTNLEPEDLVDEAFLRRIPYKIFATDPSDEEFYQLFKIYCDKFGCEYRKEVVTYLLETHFRGCNRAKRRCHPRDLLSQIQNYCRYNGIPMELLPKYFDIVVESYFATVIQTKHK